MRVRALSTQRRGADLDLLDVPYLNLDDQAGLEKEARMSDALGFTGKASIHPETDTDHQRGFFTDARAGRSGPQDFAEFEKDETGLVVVDGELIERPGHPLDAAGAGDLGSSENAG